MISANYEQTAKTFVIYVSFETLRPPKDVDHFIKGYAKKLPQLQREISTLLSPSTGKASSRHQKINPNQFPASLIILDTIHPLLSLQTPQLSLSSFLTFLLPSPQTSLLATYHVSIPTPHSLQHETPYSSTPLSLLSYLATTLITISPLHHVLAEKRANDKAQAPPLFGLEAGDEGILLGLGANGGASAAEGGNSIVLRVEYRRKSGRSVGIDAVFSPSNIPAARVGLLDEHPLYAPRQDTLENEEMVEKFESTFSLDLTDKQRRDREGVVLPYFDAQKGTHPGEGGRILYQMGEEDLGDWDEEEDEI